MSSESGAGTSSAPLLAELGPRGSGDGPGERSLARPLVARLESDWLLLADHGFSSFADWCTADDTGAALLWRVGADLRLPVPRPLDDGSYLSVVIARRSGGSPGKRCSPPPPRAGRWTRRRPATPG